MKKAITVVLIIIVCFTMMLMLTSCEKGNCEGCGTSGRVYQVTWTDYPVTSYLCGSCRDYSKRYGEIW